MSYLTALEETLERTHIGDAIQYGGLTMWPLLGPDLEAINYKMLSDSMALDLCSVAECKKQQIAKVSVTNKSNDLIFAIHGQALKGGKQNRSINVSTLFAPSSNTVIDVAGIEQHRWDRDKKFTSACKIQPAISRFHKNTEVIHYLYNEGVARADQSRIWRELQSKHARMQVETETGDALAIQTSYMQDLACYQNIFQAKEPSQIGAIFRSNGITAMELFDTAKTYKNFSAALISSFALESLESPIETGLDSNLPRAALNLIYNCEWLAALVAGEGEHFFTKNLFFNGTALIKQNSCIHISASA